MKENVRCLWRTCAHGMSVASSEGEGCYAGDVTKADCDQYTTEEEWEKICEGVEPPKRGKP